MSTKNQVAASGEERENRLVRKDFTFVVILNSALLALMVTAFFWNRSTGGLDQLLSQLIKF